MCQAGEVSRVAVIGSGWGQLAAALRLAARGHDVVLLCSRPAPLALQSVPNRILVPAGLRELFGRTGAELGDVVTIAASEPALTAHHPAGLPICLPGAGVGPSIGAVRAAREDRSAHVWRAVLAEGARIWSAMRDGVSPVAVDPDAASAGANGPDSLLERVRTEPDPVVGMLAAAPAILAGLDPARTPAAGIALAYLEATFGVWHVVGGLHELAQAMVDRLDDLGATLVCDELDVTVEARSGRVAAVRTQNQSYPVDLVVAGPDHVPDSCLELLLRPGPDTPAPGAHVWFPSGLYPKPGYPLAIAGWIDPDSSRGNRAAPARLVVRLPKGCPLTLDEALAQLAAAGTDLRPTLVSATNQPTVLRPRVCLRPAGDAAGIVSLTELAGTDLRQMPAIDAESRLVTRLNPAPGAGGRSRTGPIPWAAAGAAPWTGMTGQLLQAEELARSLG